MGNRNVKNLRIMRVLLGKPDGSLSKYRLAKEAGSSIPWTIEFLRKLEMKKLASKTKVLDFDRLVDYYAEVMPKIKYFEFFVQDPLKMLKESKLGYALTTYGAENKTSRHLFPSRYDVYIKEEDLDKWKSQIAKHGLFGKGNLRLILARDSAIFKESRAVRGINLVSLPQLLIDLKKEGGVAVEGYKLLVKRNV